MTNESNTEGMVVDGTPLRELDRSEIEYDLSASRVKTWASCPKKYELKYIQENPETKAKLGYGIRGSLVHESIEKALLDIDFDLDDISKNRLYQKFRCEYEQAEERSVKELEVVSDDMRETALDCLEVAAGVLAKMKPDIRAVEEPVLYTIDELDSTVFGHIDVTTESGVWDWKTGRVNEDRTGREEIIQGAMYLGGYYRCYGEMPDEIAFVYIHPDARKYYDPSDEDGACIRRIDPSHENWDTMLDYARSLISGKNRGEYPAKPDEYKCKFCAYEHWCPASETSPGQLREAIQETPQLWEAF